MFEAECASAQREIMEIRERELAVEDKETAVAPRSPGSYGGGRR